MAAASEFDHRAAAGGSDTRIAIAGDRTAAFRQARRHSLMVGVLRKTLPVVALAVIGFYGLAVMRTTRFGERLPQVTTPRIDPINLTMDNPHYEGFNANGGKYVVSAATAQQELSKLGVYKLTGITGRITQPDASTTDLAARSGTYDNGTSLLELFEQIEVAGSTGIKAHMTRATVQVKESIVKSSEPVVVEMPSGTVRALGMTLRQKSRDITFAGDVRTHLVMAAKPAAAVAPAPASASMFGASGGPLDIGSARLDVDDNTKTAVFSGDVKAVQGDSALQAPELTVSYEGQAATPGSKPAASPVPGSPAAVAPVAAPQGASKVKRIVAKGPVLLTRGITDQATSDSLEHDAATEITVLAGNVVLTSVPDRRVTGDRAELDSRADTALLTGAVDILQGRNTLHGRRLFIDRKAGRTHLTSPPEKGQSSRISARFYRGEAQPATAAPKVPAKPAAVDEGAAVGAFKTDPSAPVDIDAERLDVDDRGKAATFHGDVHAVQGDFVIRTAELVVRYSGSTGLVADAKDGKDTKADPAAAAGTQLTKIEARKKVVITSAKSGQRAVGDWAEFDVKANTVLLGGTDVVLSQGQNVVRGTQLKIDMTTGETRIINDAALEGWQARAQPKGKPAELVLPLPGATGPKQDRPSAVFYLPEKGAKAGLGGGAAAAAPGTPSVPAPAAPAAAAKGASGGGWQARTAPTPGQAAGQATKNGD